MMWEQSENFEFEALRWRLATVSNLTTARINKVGILFLGDFAVSFPAPLFRCSIFILMAAAINLKVHLS